MSIVFDFAFSTTVWKVLQAIVFGLTATYVMSAKLVRLMIATMSS
jgi:O6-methylguanine-DNA--protein-cysteine methyltransferase